MTRDGIRAVALAAMMILSVVVVGVGGLSGSVAAASITVNDDGGAQYSSIQEAVDNASDGDLIIVENGTYDQVVINRDNDPRNLTIRAASGASPVVTYDQAGGEPTIAVDQDDVTIEGLVIKRISSTNVAQAVRVAGNDVELINNTYEVNSQGDAAIAVLTDSSGAANNPSFSGDISNVEVSGGEIIASNTVGASGIVIADTGSASLDTGAVSINNVEFSVSSDNTNLVELDTGGGVADVPAVVDANEFDSAAAPSTTESAASINGLSVDGIITTDIQSAVDAGVADTTVKVSNGTYDEQVIIDSNLTIDADSAATLSYPSPPGSSYAANSYMVVNNSSSVEINGLEFNGPFAASNTAGLFVTGNASVDLNDASMVKMFEPDSDGEPSGVQAHGAIALGHERYTDSDSFGTIEISGSEIDEFGKFAVQVSGGHSSAEIRNTRINGSGNIDTLAQDSILVDSGEAVVANNTFADVRSTGNTGTGVTVYGPSNNIEIRNNEFDDVNKAISLQSFRSFDDTPGVIEGVIVRDNTVRDQFQAVDIYSEGIDADEVVVQNLTFTENTILDGNTGLAALTGQVVESDIEDNTFDNNSVQVYQPRGTFNGTQILSENDLDAAAYLGQPNTTIYTEVQPVINGVVYEGTAAQDGDTINVEPGTYNDSVAIDTAGVTIKGPNADQAGSSTARTEEAIISGQVDIGASNVTVTGVQVTPDTKTFEGKPAAAVYVAASDATVENTRVGDFAVNITEIGVSSVQGIQIYSANTELTDVVVRNNSVENVSYEGSSQAPDGDFGTDYGNLYGIHVQGEISDATVERNSLRDLSSDGYVLGTAVSGTDSDPDGTPENIVVERNTFQNLSAEGAPATAFVVSSDRVDVSSLSISGNTFETPVAVASGASETVDATLNYFGNTTPTVQGDVAYDPFLTVEPDEVDAESLEETTQFGHDLVVPADGTPHSVAFPAPVEGNVSEVFGEFNGTVFAYDGDGWENGSEIADEDVGALDAFAVTVDEGEEDLRIAFEYASSDAQYPTSADLKEGWNFVGAPESGNSTDAFDVTTTNIQTVSHINAGAGSQPYGASSTAPFATNPDSVSPFQGYWVFVTDDGELGATVPVGPTQSNEEGALAGN